MPDAVLDDPGLVAVRERFWTAALTEERYTAEALAILDGSRLTPQPRWD